MLAAGPLAGFALLLPVAVVGIACSKVVPGIGARAELSFGTPALFWILERLLLPGAATAEGTRARIAVEGYVNNQLLTYDGGTYGGVVLDMLVPMPIEPEQWYQVRLPSVWR